MNNIPLHSQPIEMLVGLNVIDDDAYDAYRREMEPILHAIGGGIGDDFRIKETLRSRFSEPINRIFTIFFPNEQDMKDFFDEPRYREIKARHFERSVSVTIILAKYQGSAHTSSPLGTRVTE